MSGFLIQPASRKKVKIKIGISGPSGSGKTYSALLLANGIADWEKICVIDTERDSASLYSHLGNFSSLSLEAPFTPERYMEALDAVVNAGFEVCIIDSITHEWDGVGGILEVHEKMSGNSFTNWAKLTPRHTKFVNKIIEAPIYVITCGRTKQDWVLSEKNGKMVPEKVGLKTITREGFDYEVTLAFELDIKHWASAAKDRTGLFMDKPQFVISQETGKEIAKWCNSGKENPYFSEFLGKINTAGDLAELKSYGNVIKNYGFSELETGSLRQAYRYKLNALSKPAPKPAAEALKPAEAAQTIERGNMEQAPAFEAVTEIPDDLLALQELPPDEIIDDLPFPGPDPKSANKVFERFQKILVNTSSVKLLDLKYDAMKLKEDYKKLEEVHKNGLEKYYEETRNILEKEGLTEDSLFTEYMPRLEGAKTMPELTKVWSELIKTAGYNLSDDDEKNILFAKFNESKNKLCTQPAKKGGK